MDAAGQSLAPGDAVAVRITVPNGKEWLLLANPERREVLLPLADGSRWKSTEAFEVIPGEFSAR